MVKTAAAVSLLAPGLLGSGMAREQKQATAACCLGDSFVDSFLRASKNSVLARRGKSQSMAQAD